MIVDIVDKYRTDDNNPIKNLRLKEFFGSKPICFLNSKIDPTKNSNNFKVT